MVTVYGLLKQQKKNIKNSNASTARDLGRGAKDELGVYDANKGLPH
jgi:hypothetical protein